MNANHTNDLQQFTASGEYRAMKCILEDLRGSLDYISSPKHSRESSGTLRYEVARAIADIRSSMLCNFT
ncbi:MAG: hypothetical protein ACTSUE_24520 [Promethearchaeota archaeon]